MSTSSTSAPKPGQPIPTPPDFPVTWDDPKDAKLTWSLFPANKTPIPPLIHCRRRRLFRGLQCRL